MAAPSSRRSANPCPQAQYSVEFECISKLVVYFKEAPDLTDREILAKALRISDSAFGYGGSLTVERTSAEGSYALVGLGVDTQSSRILAKPETQTETKAARPQLTLLKGA